MRNRYSSRPSRSLYRSTKKDHRQKNNKTFNPTMMVRQATVSEPLDVVEIMHQFTDFAVSDTLKNNIASKGYTSPTPIQDQIIPHILAGRDVVGIANTGTGKTAAFLIPLIEKVSQDKDERILIITPTRELASQIQSELFGFTPGMGIYSAVCIGGIPIARQVDKLRRSPQFIIGTPGRLKDLAQQGYLRLEQMKSIVLDEVDQMLDMGFIHDIRHLIGLLSTPRHSLFFSATLPDNVRGIMDRFLTDPISISVKTKDSLDNIDQDVVKVGVRSKLIMLQEMLNDPEFNKVLVFGSTKWKLNKLEKALRDNGYRVSAIHGNKSQQQRQRVLKQFKQNGLQALLATDVVARGIDIDDVSHVINFDMPQTYEDYIHRIGRTGRANKAGKAITFVD